MNTVAPKTLEHLQWPRILAALGERTKTDLGRALALQRPFLETAGAIERELSHSGELAALSVREQATLPLWGIHDIAGPLARAAKGGTLEGPELLELAGVLHALARVRDFVESRRDRLPLAWDRAELLADLSKLANRIERSFEADGSISDRASATLGELRNRLRGLHRAVKSKIEAMLADENFAPLLRDRYFTIRNDRYVLPVLAQARNEVPGIVHNASQSGQTLFIEPQPVAALGNELAIAASMVTEEERRILTELTGYLGAQAEPIASSLQLAAELDATEAAAKLAIDLECTPARALPSSEPFRMSAMRHPILLLQGKKVVPNDVGFTPEESVLVISGPNAGGKTVTLTGLGLCALMLRAGLALPVEEGSTLPLFDTIETAIGDAQDMARDLSTFSAHLTALRDIAQEARPGTLILIDEIAADTDPREGAAIALAVLEDFVAKGARAVVTTHLEELKAVAVTDTRYVNARVGFDPIKLAPTYRLQLGSPGTSSAIEVARRIGLSPAVCDKAVANLELTSGPLGRALTELDRQRGELERARIALDHERRLGERERTELRQERDAVKAREKAIVAEARQELVAEIEKARAEVATLVASLQTAPTIKRAVEAQGALAATAAAEAKKAQLATEALKTSAEERLPEGTPIEIGMKVRVAGMGDATVLEISGLEAVVLAGVMKLRRPLTDLMPMKGLAKKTPFPQGKRSSAAALQAAEKVAGAAATAPSSRLDVRGMRADDGIQAVETFLDRCYGDGARSALIVHGHGTGALRAGIRDYLKRSPYIVNQRPGNDREGGEGATVVEFKG